MAFDWTDPDKVATARMKAIQAGYKPKDVDTFIKDQQTNAATESLLSQGVLDPTEAAKDKADRVLVQKTFPKGVPATVDKKKQAETSTVMNLINNLERHYQGAGGAETTIGPLNKLLGFGKNIQGALNLNPEAKTFNDERSGFVASLKSLTGDTGVLTEQDAERLLNLIPTLGATPEEATSKFNDLRGQIATKYGGGAAGKTTISPGNKNAFEALLPATANYAKNIAAEREALKTMPPEEAVKKANEYIKMGNPMNFAYGLATGNETANKVAAPVTELAGDALALEGGKAIGGGLRSLAKNIVGGTGKLATQREIAAKGIVANTKPLIDAGEEYVKDINPMAAEAWETLKPAIKNTTDLNKLLKITSDWGDKAYTSSGDVRAIAEGQLKNHLYKAARSIEQGASEEVAGLTKQIARRKSVEGLVKKAAVPAAISAAAATPISIALYSMFGPKR